VNTIDNFKQRCFPNSQCDKKFYTSYLQIFNHFLSLQSIQKNDIY
jgi:hypothetical protein